MNSRQLHRYCDEVLRILYKNRNEGPVLFGVGDFRNDEQVADDLFVKLNISEEDAKTVIQALEDVYQYVETDAKQKTHYYDLETKENIHSAIYAVKITEAGKYFIQTNSFARETRWKRINRWLPNIPNIVGTAAVLISVVACVISFRDSREKSRQLAEQKQELLKIKDEENKLIHEVDSMLNKRAVIDGLSGTSAGSNPLSK